MDMETKLYAFPDPNPHQDSVNWEAIIATLVNLNDPRNAVFVDAYFGNHDHRKSARHQIIDMREVSYWRH